MAETGNVMADAQDVLTADGGIAQTIKLLPYGNPFFGRDGRGPWILRDRAQADRVLALTRLSLGGVDMMIDYDHASELAAPEGKGRALAAGWVRELAANDDGIWATIDWTPQAETELKTRQYRYISPYFRVDKDTREVTRIVNAALTNTPNLELPALASFRLGLPPSSLSDEERAVCAAMGWEEAKILEAKLEDARAEAGAEELGGGLLNAGEQAVCKHLGISPAAFLATRGLNTPA